MTTDTYPKIVEEHVPGDEGCSIAGVAKGAGMMNPLFATMLAFVFTDYPLDPIRMRRLLPTLGRETFERISVDGDTSTNDTLMLFSTGRGTAQAGDGALKHALARVMKALALLIVRDGEGATKVIHLTVKGAQQKRVAEVMARRIAVSPLVKTAFFGCDPNWGRVIAAAGDAGVPLDPGKSGDRHTGRGARARGRRGALFGRKAQRADGRAGRSSLSVDLHDGRASYDMYTTDLTLRLYQDKRLIPQLEGGRTTA